MSCDVLHTAHKGRACHHHSAVLSRVRACPGTTCWLRVPVGPTGLCVGVSAVVCSWVGCARDWTTPAVSVLCSQPCPSPPLPSPPPPPVPPLPAPTQPISFTVTAISSTELQLNWMVGNCWRATEVCTFTGQSSPSTHCPLHLPSLPSLFPLHLPPPPSPSPSPSPSLSVPSQ